MEEAIIWKKVVYPNFNTFLSRLNTFTDKRPPIGYTWKNMNINCEKLASAGFFFIGNVDSDCCYCYKCGGHLGKWETSDIPFKEHALWYPECPYIKLIKGQRFIDNILNESIICEIPRIKTNKECFICNELLISEIKLFPCNHSGLCNYCASCLTRCPLCRQTIDIILKK